MHTAKFDFQLICSFIIADRSKGHGQLLPVPASSNTKLRSEGVSQKHHTRSEYLPGFRERFRQQPRSRGEIQLATLSNIVYLIFVQYCPIINTVSSDTAVIEPRIFLMMVCSQRLVCTRLNFKTSQ